MQVHSFQDLVTKIVHLSTRDGKSIPITWSGTDAYTNTQSVNLPTLPSGTILTPHQLSIWLGYTIHEGPGHQTHTDLYLYQEACKQRDNPTFSYILNLLEDIRIENADIRLYPGDRKYLDSTHQFVDNQIPPHLAKSPHTLGLIYSHLYQFHRHLNTNIIKGTLNQSTATLVSEIDNCQSTQDCINLADKLVAHLKERENEENKPHQGTSPETNNNGSDDGLGNSSEDGKGYKEDEEGSPTEGRGQNLETSDQSTSDQSADVWQELTEIKNIINQLKDQTSATPNQKQEQDFPDQNLKDKSIFPPVNISKDRIYIPSNENLLEYNQTRARCSSQILALKKMFRIYLQAQTKKATIRGLDEGKLDAHRLHLPSCGSNLIFKDQTNRLLPETAIELMIDMSGSMDANLARTSAIILAEALNSIPQIKLSISGFTTNTLNGMFHRNINSNTGRLNGMDILTFKSFSEPYTKAKGKLGAITNTGFTPLGDAYGHALEHIINRPETRKIIFLITDGMPEFSHGENHSDYLLMKKIHLTCKRFQIQTLSLGIGDRLNFLEKYFDKNINISKIETLPHSLLHALKSFI